MHAYTYDIVAAKVSSTSIFILVIHKQIRCPHHACMSTLYGHHGNTLKQTLTEGLPSIPLEAVYPLLLCLFIFYLDHEDHHLVARARCDLESTILRKSGRRKGSWGGRCNAVGRLPITRKHKVS